MAQPTAPVHIAVITQVFARDTSNPQATKEFEETVALDTTVANYATDLTAFGTAVWNSYQNLLTQAGATGGLSFLQGSVVVTDVTAQPATPARYSTTESASTPVAVAVKQSYGSDFRTNFQLGVNDFTDASTLATAIHNQISTFITSTGY